jgi:polysaccharide export outer membrane protein
MRLRWHAALLLAGLLWAGAAGAAPVEVSGIAWEADSLVLRFRTAPPPIQVAVEPWGLDLHLVGQVGPDDAPLAAAGVSAERDGTGWRLRVERPGAVLRSVRYDAEALILTMAAAPAPAAEGVYRIGVGDVVGLSVYKNPDLGGDLTVGPDGMLNLPLVGPVQAKGRTENELADQIRRRLAEEVLVDPQVSVTVKTYQSQFVYVSGSVARSERIPLRAGMSVKDVLSDAGVALAPGQEVLLTRAGSAEPRTLSAEDMDAERAIAAQDGDVLTVQERRYVILHGEVKRPGKVVARPGITLLEAIVSAEGLTDWASKKDIRILRKGAAGAASEEVVNLRDVESGRIPDPVLRAGDVVMIRRRFL